MASDLRKKTQEAMDLLRESVAGCQLALLIDRETGLALCKSTVNVVPQNRLEQLSAAAQRELAGSLIAALPQQGTEDGILTALYVGKDEVVAVLKSLRSEDDALVCQFTDLPNRSDLIDAAEAVFSVSVEAEAA